MGKAGRWWRGLFLGSKKQPSASSSSPAAKEKKSKWGLLKSKTSGGSYNHGSQDSCVGELDANKHAIAVAAATAAVAEAALAAAQAAAEVVRLTSGNNHSRTAQAGETRRRELAAVKIQSAFRAYLARRALRALKGLVKLQALVRGRIVRKQSADMLRRMQAMVRIQARACASRACISDPPRAGRKTSQSQPQPHPRQMRRGGSKSNNYGNSRTEKMHPGSHWLDRWMDECTWNNNGNNSSLKNHGDNSEEIDKILEIDTWKPRADHKSHENRFRSSQHYTWKESGNSTFDTISRDPANFRKLLHPEVDHGAVWTAESSPCVHSASSRPGSSRSRGPFTPIRSECSRSLYGDYIGHPNYMANTESSRAKVRSQSAPRQRLQFEKLSTSSMSIPEIWDRDTNSEKGLKLHTNFRNKAYPGSGRLDRHRVPVHAANVSYGSTFGTIN